MDAVRCCGNHKPTKTAGTAVVGSVLEKKGAKREGDIMARKKKSDTVSHELNTVADEINRELLDKQATNTDGKNTDYAGTLPSRRITVELLSDEGIIPTDIYITYPMQPKPNSIDDSQKHADDINQSAMKTHQRLQSDLDALIQANEEAEKQRWQQREEELANLEVDKSKPFLGAADVAYMLKGKRDENL